MDAATRCRLLIAGSALLAVGLLCSTIGVLARPDMADIEVTVRTETIEPWAAAERKGVPSLVAAIRRAGRNASVQLRELADSEDPLVAGNAIAALGRLGEVDADSDLVDKLADPRPRVRHEVVAALGLGGDPAAARHLTPFLKSDDEQARLLAIQSLIHLGVHEPLRALLADPATDPETKAFARAASSPAKVPELLATTSGLRRP